jgi:mono/diheme cytochrome c family protein
MRGLRYFAEIGVQAGLAAVLVGLAGWSAASAQDQSSEPTFTAEQADRGHAAYRSSCQDCHGSTLDNGEFGGPPLKGGYFRGRWGAGSVAVLYGYLALAMPPDRPGQLSPRTYADLVAFLLSNNGYAPGDKELPPDPDALQRMTLKK